jgi:drug/metabolite transporter (DMT)-like permease
MSALALTLVLLAAVAHAGWNYLAKKACGGPVFVWLFAVASAVMYAPVAGYVIWAYQPHIGLAELGFILGSAVFHAIYFLLLDKGYQIGDLSVIYPLARGTGPLFATVAAVLLLGERPSLVVIIGTLAIAAGIVILTGNPAKLREPANRRPVLFAILCGIVIAAYTVWDKIAVASFFIPPILYDWATNFGRVFLLTPMAIRGRAEIGAKWRENKWSIIAIAFLSPLAYILVLTAMVFSPVSYIAPAREISILIGTLFGTHLLREGNVKPRLAAAGAMVVGLVALAIG